MATNSQDFNTIIGPDASFKGDLKFESSAQVLGKIEGTITAKGRLEVSGGSECKATVLAKEVIVEGHIQGNVEAGDLVELKPKGMITGDIVAARMSMAEGAAIDGHCRIGVSNNAGGSAKSSTEVKPAAIRAPKVVTT
ncbi:MAG: polymer-forming cytoskeletal protein [Planctomycetota bacterium]|nr:polymer-forming cytoskeletal protein [Planctomycetota bacterium]